MLKGMFVSEIILFLIVVIRVFFRSRSDTALEVLALRQQSPVLKRKQPRPKLNWLLSLLALAIPATRRSTEDYRGDSR